MTARRSMRPCPTPGCGALTYGGPCPDCRREREQARGTRQARGYDEQHLRTRARLLAELVDGAPCDRCGEPMTHRQQLDAAHPHDRGLRVDPSSRADHLEHARCNRGARDT